MRIFGKNFSAFGRKNFRRDFQKCILRLQRNTFRIIAFFSKCWLFLVTSGDCGRNFGLPVNFFRHDYHNCILSDHWNALREKMQFWNFFVFLPFSDRERTFLALWQNLPIWLPKLLPSCRLAHFEENLFIEQNLFVTFSWSGIDRRFFGFMAKHFSLLALFLQQDWQNCLLLVLKNSLR